MAKADYSAILDRLAESLSEFAQKNGLATFEHLPGKSIKLVFTDRVHPFFGGEGLWAEPGHFEAVWDCVNVEWEPLKSDHDIIRALAVCDALLLGRGVFVAGPGGYPNRSYLFLNSRGVRETVRDTGVYIGSCRRARTIAKSKWSREKLPPLRTVVY